MSFQHFSIRKQYQSKTTKDCLHPCDVALASRAAHTRPIARAVFDRRVIQGVNGVDQHVVALPVRVQSPGQLIKQ